MEQTQYFKLCKKFYNNQETQQVEQQIKDSIINIPGVSYFRGKNDKITVFFNSEDNPFYLKLLEQGFRKPNQQPSFQSKKQRLLSKNINKYQNKTNQTILQKCNVTNLSISSSESSSSKKSKKQHSHGEENIEEQKFFEQSKFYKRQQKKLQDFLVDLIQNQPADQLTYSKIYKLLLQKDQQNSTDFASIAFNEKQYVVEFLEQEIKDREVMLKFHQIQQGYCCGSLNNSQNNIITNSQDIQNSAFNKIPVTVNNNKNSFFENLESDSTKNQTIMMINQSSNKVSISKEMSMSLQKEDSQQQQQQQYYNSSPINNFNKKPINNKAIRHTKGSVLLKKKNVIKQLQNPSTPQLQRKSQSQQQQQIPTIQPPDYKKQIQQIVDDIEQLQNCGSSNNNKLFIPFGSNSFDHSNSNFVEQKIDQEEQRKYQKQQPPNNNNTTRLRVKKEDDVIFKENQDE